MEATWLAVFGHDDPYDQVDGIETAERGGFTVVEGACGTGKTMLALAAGIDRVRDSDGGFERVMALTSVKQQPASSRPIFERSTPTFPTTGVPSPGSPSGSADVPSLASDQRGKAPPSTSE